MSEPRHGQWVKFAAEIPGAHLTPDGQTLGIYQRAREAPRVVKAGVDTASVETQGGEIVPAHVAVVRPDGTNLMRLSDCGNHAVKMAIAPHDCPGLEPAAVPADLPRCPRTAHLFAE